MQNTFINPLFGKRLEYLMQCNDLDTTKKGASAKLAKKMIEKRCLNFLVNEDPKGKLDSARGRIEVHRSTGSAENVEGKWLKAYCDYFGCSADYLFGYIDLPTKEKTDINRLTGLSGKAVDALQILHCPKDASVEGSQQIGRYDIIALNLILEDFYDRYKSTESHLSFSDETRTALDCIGKYIDADSVSNPPLIKQNGVTSLYNPREVAQQIAENNLHDCLKKLHDDYSLAIKQRKKENADYFHGLFKNEIEKTLQETRREK